MCLVYWERDSELARDMHQVLLEGHLDNAFSITIWYDPYQDVSEGVIYDGEVIEISLVFRGSNPSARLLEVSKSLMKGLSMTKEEIEAKRKSLAEKRKELEAEEGELAEAEQAEPGNPEGSQASEPAPDPKPEDPKPDPAPENPKPDEAKPAEEPKPEDKKPDPAPEPDPTPEPGTQPKEEPKKEEPKVEEKTKSIAQKQAAANPSSVEPDAQVATKRDPNEHKILVVKQFMAFVNKDMHALRELNEFAMKMDTADLKTKALKKKELTYTDGAPLYLAEQLDKDVDRQYADVGNVGKLVNRITLVQSPKYRKIVRLDGVRFTPQGFKGKKSSDKPVWGSFTLEPKPYAVIIPWSDHTFEDSMINTYDEIVADIAEGRTATEDQLILTFESVVANETTYPDQGLMKLLDASREVSYDLTAAGFQAAFGQAWGKIHSSARRNISLVMNGAEWGYISMLTDTTGRPLYIADEQGRINLGALGKVLVATSDELDVGQMVVGNFQKYDYASKGGLQLKGSSDATVGALNLFEEDASALRAVIRDEGGTARTNAFVKMVRDTGESS